MSTTSTGFNETSTVLGSLGNMSGNPDVATCLNLASLATGVIGSIIDAKAAAKEKKETTVYREAVLTQLTQLTTQLSVVKGELGEIETQLQKVDKQLEAANNMKIANQLAVIDSFVQDFQALPINSSDTMAQEKHNKQLKKLSDKVFDPTKGVLNAMNNVNEMLTGAYFSSDNALQGNITVPGYLYIKTKLLQGLHVIGYASIYAGYDFGTFLKDWSQIFANQMQIIIDYGKANPGKGDVYTAHFDAKWEDGVDKSLYCTDAIPFCALINPTMPFGMSLYYGLNNIQQIFDGSSYPFINHFYNSIYKGKIINPILTSGWNISLTQGQYDKSYPIQWRYAGSNGIEIKKSTLMIINEPTNSANYQSPFSENYSLHLGALKSNKTPDINKDIYLAPEYTLGTPPPGIYLGSVDGMLNFLPATNGSKNNSQPGKMTAFICDGNDKNQLLKSGGETPTKFDSLKDITSLTHYAFEFTYYKEGYVCIRLSDKNAGFGDGYIHLNVIPSSENPQEGEFFWEGQPCPLKVLSSFNPPQKVQAPFDMAPVPIQLGVMVKNSKMTGYISKTVIIHQSPFITPSSSSDES